MMKLRFLIATLLAFAGGPAAAGYTSLVVLGDSLSDMGNAASITGGVFPGTPNGRASNGAVAAEYLANRLGISGFAPSQTGGTNYAVVGATTGSKNFNFEINNPAGLISFPDLQSTGLASQLGQIIASGPFDPVHTLFMVQGGANDIFLADALAQDPVAAATAAVGNLASIVGGLRGIGAAHILVVGFPDLGVTPEAIARGALQQAQLSALSAGFNLGLTQTLNALVSQIGGDIRLFDEVSVLNEILQAPADFGFTNTTDACTQSTAALATNCAGYVFFDEVHPTTALHALIGERLFHAVPEPCSVCLMLSPLMVLIAHRRRTR